MAKPRSTSMRKIARVCGSLAATPVLPAPSTFTTTVRAGPVSRLTRHGDPPISADAFAHDRTRGASRTTVPAGSER